MIEKPNYTQTPNLILDNMADYSPSEFKFLMAVCRKTFGFHKKVDAISLSQLEEMTGLSKPTLVKVGEELSTRESPLLEIDRAGRTNKYRLLVKNFNQLNDLTVKQLNTLPDGSVNLLNTLDPQLVKRLNTQKKDLLLIIYKILDDDLDGISKEIDSLSGEDKEVAELVLQHHRKQIEQGIPAPDTWHREEASLLRNAIMEKGMYGTTYENRVGLDTILNEWSDEIAKLERIDGYKMDTIREVLRYIRDDNDFWIPKGALRSATSLRNISEKTKQTKFEMMYGNYKNEKRSNNNSKSTSYWDTI